jgi:hypothetical protein
MLNDSRPIILAIATGFLCTACGPESGFMEATVNGEVWQSEHVTCIYDENTQELDVSGWRSTGSETKQWIRLRHVPSVLGAVMLAGDEPHGVISETDQTGWDTISDWSTTDESTGTVTVTEFRVAREFEMERNRCSGSFSFVAVPSYGAATDTMYVSDGSWMVEPSILIRQSIRAAGRTPERGDQLATCVRAVITEVFGELGCCAAPRERSHPWSLSPERQAAPGLSLALTLC